jgi:hypothetical protein
VLYQLSYTPSGDPFAATRAAMQERRICVSRIRGRQATDSAELAKTGILRPISPARLRLSRDSAEQGLDRGEDRFGAKFPVPVEIAELILDSS